MMTLLRSFRLHSFARRRGPGRYLPWISLLGGLLLVACSGPGGETGPAGPGDAARGEKLYRQTVIGSASAPGCVTCHSLEPDVQLVGPSHAGLAERAAGTVPGLTAEAFLRQSVIEPNAHVSEGYASGLMYPNYGRELSEQQLNDLVAFMLTLRGDDG